MSEENKDREELGQVVDSIALHPGLQTVSSEEGETPADDQYVESFYDRHTPGDRKSPAETQTPEAVEPAPSEGNDSGASQEPAVQHQPAPTQSAADAERELQALKEQLRERNAENLALKAVNQNMESLRSVFQAPQQPQGPTKIPVAFDEKNQPYIPYDEVESHAQERISRLIEQRIQESLRPLTQASQTYSKMRSEFPSFESEEAQFSQWLDANPNYKERIAQDPEGGIESAYLRFHYDTEQVRNTQTSQNAVAAQQTVTSAQRHASPAGGASTPTRRITESDARNQKMKELLKYAQETGDFKPLYKARLEEGIGASYLNTIGNSDWGR